MLVFGAEYKVFYINVQKTERYCDTWRDVRYAEASEVHDRWLKTRIEDYSQEVRDMLIRGTTISAVDYTLAKRVINEELKKGFLTILNRDIDVLVMSTTPRSDELMTTNIGDTVMQTREALLRNTTVFNSIGFPAVSLPIGLTKGNMPVAAQIIGPPFTEGKILSVAYNYECVDHK